MSGTIKKSTGLAGLLVCKNPHHILEGLYGKILRALSKIPEEAAYRKYTHKIICERLIAVQETATDIKKLEETIGCGQAEQLVIQAENELNLARKMIVWKPWEPLMAEAPKKQWDWPPHQKMSPKV